MNDTFIESFENSLEETSYEPFFYDTDDSEDGLDHYDHFESGELLYDVNETDASPKSVTDLLTEIRDAVIDDGCSDVVYSAPLMAPKAQYADLSNQQVYKLSNGFYAVFDNDVDLYLSNGYLVNSSGSTVVGYYVQDPSNVNVRANQQTIHIFAPNSTNILRYGSNMYVTTYYSTSTGGYASSVQYVNLSAERASKAFYNVSWWQLTVVGLLAFLVLGVVFRNLSHKI